MKRSHRGLTLIEVMVAIAVMAILAAVAFPNMSDFIDRQRLVAQTLAISELAQTARSEAIKRTGTGGHDERLVTMTITPGANWTVGLTGKPNLVSATQCEACTMSEPAAARTVEFDFRGIVRSSTVADTQITLVSPKGNKQLSVRVSRLGSITVCSPDSSVTGYRSCGS